MNMQSALHGVDASAVVSASWAQIPAAVWRLMLSFCGPVEWFRVLGVSKAWSVHSVLDSAWKAAAEAEFGGPCGDGVCDWKAILLRHHQLVHRLFHGEVQQRELRPAVQPTWQLRWPLGGSAETQVLGWRSSDYKTRVLDARSGEEAHPADVAFSAFAIRCVPRPTCFAVASRDPAGVIATPLALADQGSSAASNLADSNADGKASSGRSEFAFGKDGFLSYWPLTMATWTHVDADLERDLVAALSDVYVVTWRLSSRQRLRVVSTLACVF